MSGKLKYPIILNCTGITGWQDFITIEIEEDNHDSVIYMQYMYMHPVSFRFLFLVLLNCIYRNFILSCAVTSHFNIGLAR